MREMGLGVGQLGRRAAGVAEVGASNRSNVDPVGKQSAVG